MAWPITRTVCNKFQFSATFLLKIQTRKGQEDRQTDRQTDRRNAMRNASPWENRTVITYSLRCPVFLTYS